VTDADAGSFNITVTAISLDPTKNASINTTTYVQSLPPDLNTSYWGTVKILSTTAPNAVVKVYGANSAEIASTTSDLIGQYLVLVPWDDLSTPGSDEGAVSGETLTFKVNGSIATTRVVDTKGTNTHLNLSVVDNVAPVITVTFRATTPVSQYLTGQ